MTKNKSTKRALLMSVLSLLLCISMLIGTTYAWFTDTVTSAGNIIKAGNLDVEMYWADGDEDPTNASWIDASAGAMFTESLWEPGFTEAKHIKVANAGNLALKYQMRILANGVVSTLADVIDVYYFEDAKQLSRSDMTDAVKLGTLSEVLKNNNDLNVGNADSLSAKIAGSLEPKGSANDSKIVTIALKMQESAGNEYQGLTIGSDFSVQLLATQYTYEEDSFDKFYDKGADFAPQKTPSAMVSKLNNTAMSNIVIMGNEDVKLDVGYKFEPTETAEQGAASDYQWWHADFYVTADKDVAANSMMLAGYFKLYGDLVTGGKWVGMTSNDTVAAGEGIRLIQDGVATMLGGNYLSVAYSELCLLGNDGTGFQCGAVDLSGSNAGTTLTVELRLYEATCDDTGCHHNQKSCETGNYITVGTFTYTFPAAEVSTAAELKNAFENGVSSIVLADDVALTEELAVPADKEVVLDLNGKNITMEADNAGSMITNNGDLTINGTGKIAYTFTGTPNNAVAANAIANRGKLTVKGGEISNSGNGNQIGYGIDNYNGATLIVDGGKITASGSSYYDGIRLFCGNKETTVTVNGGEISSIWAQNPSANKATEVKGTVIINGGTVKTTYYENYTTVKVAEGVTATVTPYGAGSGNTTSAVVDGYTVYSFVH